MTTTTTITTGSVQISTEDSEEVMIVTIGVVGKMGGGSATDTVVAMARVATTAAEKTMIDEKEGAKREIEVGTGIETDTERTGEARTTGETIDGTVTGAGEKAAAARGGLREGTAAGVMTIGIVAVIVRGTETEEEVEGMRDETTVAAGTMIGGRKDDERHARRRIHSCHVF
eukprot:TRINITY_DN11576_c0_g1_i1.p2 TRINITY_DN11576_c0_g1~~TRINITY_DN11576_c0_g1_i1.p2  ORF type:complete len:172 (+),score=36.26 TRINITY_DN11576_c0_g1_i1:54-569(+)